MFDIELRWACEGIVANESSDYYYKDLDRSSTAQSSKLCLNFGSFPADDNKKIHENQCSNTKLSAIVSRIGSAMALVLDRHAK